jgi:hypothetical protein
MSRTRLCQGVEHLILDFAVSPTPRKRLNAAVEVPASQVQHGKHQMSAFPGNL